MRHRSKAPSAVPGSGRGASVSALWACSVRFRYVNTGRRIPTKPLSFIAGLYPKLINHSFRLTPRASLAAFTPMSLCG